MSALTRIGGGGVLDAIRPKTEYHPFNPHRRLEEYMGAAGPHNGLALTHDVLGAIAEARVTGRPHPYLVRGEVVRDDGVRFLDIGVDVQWVTENSNHVLVDGFLRYQCPGCQKLSGQHARGCDYR